MRKLLLVAMLALTTMAWAHGAKKTDQTKAGNDWYQAMLDRHVDQQVKLNQTVSPAATEPAAFQAPSSMAAREGDRGEDFYNQKIRIQSEVSRRDLSALKSAP